MTGIVLLVVIVAAGVFWFVGVYNSLDRIAQPGVQRLEADRRSAQAPPRSHPESRRDGEGRDELREGDARVGDRRAQPGDRRDARHHELPSAQQVQATAAAEGQLRRRSAGCLRWSRRIPDLKATGNVAQLQEELTSTENKIAFARQLYNDQATVYNTRQQQFPGSLVAGFARATPAQLWEITDAAEREVVKVDLR